MIRAILLGLLGLSGLNAQGLAYTVDGTYLTSLSWNGVSYYLNAGFQTYEYRPGSTTPIASNLLASSSGSSPTSITHDYGSDADHLWTWKVEYMGAGTDTLQLDVYVTNNATTDALRLNVIPLYVQLPSDLVTPPEDYSWDLTGTRTPYSGLDYVGGLSIYSWGTPVANYLRVNHPTGGSGNRQIGFQWITTTTIGPTDYVETIAAGGTTKHYVMYFKFGATPSDVYTYIPDAFTNWRTTFPTILAAADRRPWGRIFYTNPGEGQSNCTATNPRCWMFGVTDITDGTFLTKMLAATNTTIGIMNARTPRPRGIIIWDVEGQEFGQPLSYVGDASHIDTLAPEMDAIIDTLVDAYVDAGYEVGFTLRPQKLLFGTTIPATCTTNATDNLRDMFIKTDQVVTGPNQREYECTATNVYTQTGAHQTDQRSYALLISDMERKIDYYQARWGTTMFYVDSNGWSGPALEASVWRELLAEYPDIIFLPEHRQPGYFDATSAYNGDQPLTIYQSETLPRVIWGQYPWIYTVVADGWTAPNTALATTGIQKGDSFIYDAWANFEQLAVADSISVAAGVANSSLGMTDSATSRALIFSGTPTTIQGTYPVTMRTYFASTTGGLAGSTTYCQQMGGVTCFASGVQQATAALNLGGMTVSQVKYYDFAGGFVAQENPQSLSGKGTNRGKKAVSGKVAIK